MRGAVAGTLIVALGCGAPVPDVEDDPFHSGSTLGGSAAPRVPPGTIRTLDESTALALAAMPLSCLDRPHAERTDRAGYLDDITYRRRPGFDRTLAFYGCWDWHSAVNSTWTLVRLLKTFPDLPIAPLMREKLRDHLSSAALQGELTYFIDNATFERPYGWAWLLKLHAELVTWREPEAATWAGHLEPLARLLGTRLVDHVADVDRPVRSGVHGNTAFSVALALEAARVTGNLAWERVIAESTLRLFEKDRACPTAYEPGGSDFVSPCLEEAAAMAAVMEPEDFGSWLTAFLPPLDHPDFAALASPVPLGERGPELPAGRLALEDDSVRSALGARSHLIGLAFTRADAMTRIARALPADDPRSEGLLDLALLHGEAGFEAMFDADYAGSHWIGSFALKYLATAPADVP